LIASFLETSELRRDAFAEQIASAAEQLSDFDERRTEALEQLGRCAADNGVAWFTAARHTGPNDSDEERADGYPHPPYDAEHGDNKLRRATVRFLQIAHST